MKSFTLFTALVCFVFLTVSCGNNNENGKTATDNSSVPEILSDNTTATAATDVSGCYLHVSGAQLKDTSLLTLTVNGTNATGEFWTSIYEKDKRRGSFTGTISDSVIKAMWNFSQEGMNDSLPLVFKLNNTGLLQKRYSYDTKSGREFIPDTAIYSVNYRRIACAGK